MTIPGGRSPFDISCSNTKHSEIVQAFWKRVAEEKLSVSEDDVTATVQVVNGLKIDIQFIARDPFAKWEATIILSPRQNTNGPSEPHITSFRQALENMVFYERDRPIAGGPQPINLKEEVYADERTALAYHNFRRETERLDLRVEEDSLRAYLQIVNGTNFIFEYEDQNSNRKFRTTVYYSLPGYGKKFGDAEIETKELQEERPRLLGQWSDFEVEEDDSSFLDLALKKVDQELRERNIGVLSVLRNAQRQIVDGINYKFEIVDQLAELEYQIIVHVRTYNVCGLRQEIAEVTSFKFIL